MRRLLLPIALVGIFFWLARHDSSLALIVGGCAVAGSALALRFKRRLKTGVVIGLLASVGFIFARQHFVVTHHSIANVSAVGSELLLVLILAVGVSFIIGRRQIRETRGFFARRQSDNDQGREGRR